MQIISPRFNLNTPLSLRSGMRPTPPSADNRLHADTFQRSGNAPEVVKSAETAFQKALSTQKYDPGSLGYALKTFVEYETQQKVVAFWEQQLESLDISKLISADSVDPERESNLVREGIIDPFTENLQGSKIKFEDIKRDFDSALMMLGRALPKFETARNEGFIKPSHIEDLKATEREEETLWSELGRYYVDKALTEQNPDWLKHFQRSKASRESDWSTAGGIG